MLTNNALNMKNIYKASLFTTILSTLFIALSISVQIRSQNKLTTSCSYVDPMTIDILAFMVTLFLIIEGIYRIGQEKDAPFKKQVTRGIRVSIGFAIFTIHIIQVLYK